MVDSLIVVVLGLLAIAGATAFGPRVGIAAPLLLVVVGIGVSLLPFVPEVEIEPEWILTVVLPPLLYSAAVSMPSMDFRREFTAIRGLSVVLVVITALLLGVFFAWVIPGLSLAWGIALGAIVSPTDAVATTIVKRLGVSGRVIAVLEGESLLNDATALVLLRAAIGATAASVSLWSVVGEFIYAVAVAVAIGFVVGHVNVIVRARVQEASVNTVLGFTVPFLASIPAEELGASGLVAAVVAGMATGRHAPQMLSARHRLSDAQNWRAIELILEGGVFLLMGLQLATILDDVRADHEGLANAAAIAAGALVLTVLIRAAYVAPLLRGLQWRARRGERMKPKLADIGTRLDEGGPEALGRLRGRQKSDERIARIHVRLRRQLADIDYFLAAPLGWKQGTIVVWAGMRGAVTLAAAQTLPERTPDRSLLIVIAFLVASASLLVQGGTLPRLVALIRPAPERDDTGDRVRLLELLAQAAAGEDEPMAVIEAQRTALLDARDEGIYSARALNGALAVLDADQIRLELRGEPAT